MSHETLDEVRNLVMGSTDNEGTSYPVWFILNPPGGLVRPDMLPHVFVGPFFSRESAENQMKRIRHNLGKKPYVWCASGEDSPDYIHLRKLLKGDAS